MRAGGGGRTKIKCFYSFIDYFLLLFFLFFSLTTNQLKCFEEGAVNTNQHVLRSSRTSSHSTKTVIRNTINSIDICSLARYGNCFDSKQQGTKTVAKPGRLRGCFGKRSGALRVESNPHRSPTGAPVERILLVLQKY